MKIFMKKDYYCSELSAKNIYYIEKAIKDFSYYENWFLVKDENNNEYVLLMEKIGNKIPDIKDMYFNLSYHDRVLYPFDIIVNRSEYYAKNEIGYLYLKKILEYQDYKYLSLETKQEKLQFLQKLYELLLQIHKEFYLMGFDVKQIFMEGEKIKIRYNGFQSHNRNSIYKISDVTAGQYSPYILDYYSLFVIMFELMYEWHPYYGYLTSFSDNEKDRFEAFFSNPVFIFDNNNKTNGIGFMINQRKILQRWQKTDPIIQKIYHDILTFRNIKNYSEEDMGEAVMQILTCYKNNDLFQ